MQPFNKPLKSLTYDDIDTLIREQIPESRTLDYKRDLYGNDDAAKDEFRYDVSAFANTAGGYLIIGVDEEKTIPKTVTPVPIENVDELQLHFQNLLRTKVDPPIRGVDFKPIATPDGKWVLVIEIPRSISRPHGVSYKEHWRFYGRHSSGKYPYAVDDLRQAMLWSETLAAKIRNFRNDRLAQISVGETPIPLFDGAKTVLHLIPMSSFELGQRYNVDKIQTINILPIYAGGCNHRINFDGLVTYEDDGTGHSFNYTQVFRNGIVEAVDGCLLQVHQEMKHIPATGYEIELVRALQRYLAALVTLGVEFPMWVCLSLLGVKGYLVWMDSSFWSRTAHPIDRAELILPEIEVEDASIPAECILKPAFDAVWNACGFERCMVYDKSGNWTPKGR
jgi:hypothetical protein